MVFKKIGLFGLRPDYFRGQAWPDLWPGMTNVKLCDICVIKMEIIICIGLYD